MCIPIQTENKPVTRFEYRNAISKLKYYIILYTISLRATSILYISDRDIHIGLYVYVYLPYCNYLWCMYAFQGY